MSDCLQGRRNVDGIEDLRNPSASTIRVESRTESAMKDFFSAVRNDIDREVADILRKKPEGASYLTYWDLLAVNTKVKAIFSNYCGDVPREVEAATEMAAAVLSPDMAHRIRHLRTVLGIAGTAVGLLLVINGVAAALGWGAGIVAAVKAVILGSAVMGPLAMVVAGAGLAGIAAYFAWYGGNPAVNSQRAISALKKGIDNAKGVIWDKYGDRIKTKYSADKA